MSIFDKTLFFDQIADFWEKNRVLTKLPIFDKKWFFEEIREF